MYSNAVIMNLHIIISGKNKEEYNEEFVLCGCGGDWSLVGWCGWGYIFS
jgi:hypothetical protein